MVYTCRATVQIFDLLWSRGWLAEQGGWRRHWPSTMDELPILRYCRYLLGTCNLHHLPAVKTYWDWSSAVCTCVACSSHLPKTHLPWAGEVEQSGYTAAYVYVTMPSGLPTMFFDQTLNWLTTSAGRPLTVTWPAAACFQQHGSSA